MPMYGEDALMATPNYIDVCMESKIWIDHLLLTLPFLARREFLCKANVEEISCDTRHAFLCLNVSRSKCVSTGGI